MNLGFACIHRSIEYPYSPSAALRYHEKMLEAQDISVDRDGRPILQRINFALGPGNALQITGQNGAGKSTLLRVIAGLRRPDAGIITWDTAPIVQNRTAHAQRVAYLGHREGLKLDLTVRENLAMFCARDFSEIAMVLQKAGLAFCVDRLARHLSAGQKRRVALAAMQLKGASIWLLDEPGIGLDHVALSHFEQMVHAHLARQGILIVTTHTALPISFTHRLSLATSHPLNQRALS